MLDQDAVKAIVDQALEAGGADELTVRVEGGRRTHLRYANNTVTTAGTDLDHTLRITATFGTRTASAEVNQLDEAAIVEVVRRAEALARVAPEDPEHMPVLGPTEHPEIRAWFPSERPDAMARGVERCLTAARSDGLVAAGYGEANERFRSLATSAGLFGYQRRTGARITQTVRTPDGGGSGWSGRAAGRPDDLDFDGLSEVSRAKAVLSRGARSQEPEEWPAILEPACVASLVGILVRSLDARRAEEGRSFLSRPGGETGVGEKLFPEWVRIRSDPSTPLCPGLSWGSGGLPHVPREWVSQGAVHTLSRGRFWAKKTGAEPIPDADTVLMDGGEGTVEDLVASTERGVLVTSLWYIRSVDPRTLVHTGLTRDGVFWIEDGAIAHPLTNYRWNESPLRVLKGALQASAPVRAPSRGGWEGRTVVPALRVERFGFSTISDAV